MGKLECTKEVLQWDPKECYVEEPTNGTCRSKSSQVRQPPEQGPRLGGRRASFAAPRASALTFLCCCMNFFAALPSPLLLPLPAFAPRPIVVTMGNNIAVAEQVHEDQPDQAQEHQVRLISSSRASSRVAEHFLGFRVMGSNSLLVVVFSSWHRGHCVGSYFVENVLDFVLRLWSWFRRSRVKRSRVKRSRLKRKRLRRRKRHPPRYNVF